MGSQVLTHIHWGYLRIIRLQPVGLKLTWKACWSQARCEAQPCHSWVAGPRLEGRLETASKVRFGMSREEGLTQWHSYEHVLLMSDNMITLKASKLTPNSLPRHSTSFASALEEPPLNVPLSQEGSIVWVKGWKGKWLVMLLQNLPWILW